MRYKCPVCGFLEMESPPLDYEICPCCGTEFGNDDEFKSYDQLRVEWVDHHSPWFLGIAPLGWNPWKQLIDAGYTDIVPQWETQTAANATISGVSSLDFSQQPWQVSAAA